MAIKNKLYGVLMVKRIKTLLLKNGLNENNGEYLYQRIKSDCSNFSNEYFLSEIAKTKDMAVYAQYFYDTLGLEPYEFSEYVANTHDAKFCALFYSLQDSNKQLLFNEIVESHNGEVCFNFLKEYNFMLNESEKQRLKYAIIDSDDIKTLKECINHTDFFKKEEVELLEFAFRAKATPKKIKEFENGKKEENEMCM